MKRLVATGLALAAAAAFTTPAHAAATTDLHLFSNWQPVTIKVNGKPVVVDGGEAGYDTTPVQVTVGSKVTLEAPATTGGMKFCAWIYGQSKNRVLNVTVYGDWRDFYSTDYGRPGDC